MATRNLFRRRRSPLPLDDLGGSADGGLAILDPDGKLLHMTPSRVAASLRYFLARVRLHEADGLPNRLALTSSLAGEGVTYVARSIAAAIAYDTDASVAIVDFNWRIPKPMQDGEPKRLGLADVIEDGVKIDDVIITTGNPRLALVPAGECAIARRPALAHSPELAAALDALDSRYDYLLLDLPPVLATSDAMNLSELADAYVLVVRHGATTESQVEAALEEMQGSDTLGVILNRFDSDVPRRLRRLVGT